MADDKMLAEWFWVDRWTGSSAVGLPLLARGLYREMLTQWCGMGGSLPADEKQIQSLVRATDAEWAEAWPKVRTFWIESGGCLFPIDDLVRVGKIPRSEPVDRRPYISVDVRRAVFERHGKVCLKCGSADFIELDHIVPFSKGGPDTVENLQPLCRPCNRSKGAR